MSNRPMTLQDLQNNRNAGARQPPRNMSNPAQGGGGARRPLFGGMDGVQEKHPRQENYCDMWTTTFCPNFTIWSFTFLNVLVQLIFYIGTLIYTSTTEQGLNKYMFLGNSLETLHDFGMRMPFEIKENGEVWRLILSLYINHGLSQLIINCLGLMFSGFMLEAQMGSIRLMLFYFISGICGNLLATTANDWYAVGAEPALLAQLAGLISMYIYFWNNIGQEEDWCRRVCGLFLCVFLLFIGIYFLTSFAQPYKIYMQAFKLAYPDTSGIFGGALFGFFLAWVFI